MTLDTDPEMREMQARALMISTWEDKVREDVRLKTGSRSYLIRNTTKRMEFRQGDKDRLSRSLYMYQEGPGANKEQKEQLS